MRPKKVVYLYCRKNMRRSVLKVALETWGFRVITEPLGDPDVALIVNDADAREEVADLDRDYPDTRIVVLIERKDLIAFDCRVGALLLDDDTSMTDLRGHLKTVAARKRGPKPRGPYGPRVAAQEAVSA